MSIVTVSSVELQRMVNTIKPFLPRAQYAIITQWLRSSIVDSEHAHIIETVYNMIKAVPRSGSGDSKAYLHYFVGATDWWIKDIDEDNDYVFGFTCLNGDTECAEYGYLSINEIANCHRLVNLDFYFKPTEMKAILTKLGRSDD
jgi:hypothetical protein